MNELVNSARFIGKVGKKPEFKFNANGNGFATFGIGVSTRSYAGKDKEGKDKYQYVTTWVDCIAFGVLAEQVKKLLDKGTLVAVDAEYQKKVVEKDGKKTTYHSFVVRQFQKLDWAKNSGGDEGEEETSKGRSTSRDDGNSGDDDDDEEDSPF